MTIRIRITYSDAISTVIWMGLLAFSVACWISIFNLLF